MEGRNVEYKRELSGSLKNSIVAFANTDGGKIYIGIEDSGAVCGIDNPDDIMLQLTNTIRDAIRPDVTAFTTVETEEIEGKNVVVLTVRRGTARPYYLMSKGIRPEGVYVRQGSSSVPASETVILQMIRETGGNHYEDMRSFEQGLSFKAAKALFDAQKLSFGKEKQRSLGLIGADEAYTNLAYLLSDQCEHSIKMARFQGSGKAVFLDRKEISGSLFRQFEEAEEYIDKFNFVHSEVKGLYRNDVRDYPAGAIREALFNALIHKEYAFSAPILISIFDDRLEFLNVGGLIRGISREDILLGVSAQRNEKLAAVFYRLKLVEAYGTGIPKIFEAYSACSEKPRIEISDNAFKLTLPNVNYAGEKGSGKAKEKIYYPALIAKDERFLAREEAVLALAGNAEGTTRKKVQDELKVSQATAVNLLRDMTERGELIRKGSGKFVSYHTAK